jgi:RraA family protein
MTIKLCAAPDQVADDLLDAYSDVPSSIISDNLDRLPGAVGILPYHRGERIIGTAFTVRTRAGDNLAIHEALKHARPGDIMVVDGGGDVTQALIGEIIAHKAIAIGLAGFVIDGAIRDVETIRQMDFPVYAKAVTHRGPYKSGPGFLNIPVAIGGSVVQPGDLIVGDSDGIVSLSPQSAREILPAVRAKMADEAAKIAAIQDSAKGRKAS